MFEKDLCEQRNLARTRELNPSLQSFSAWLKTYRDQISVS